MYRSFVGRAGGLCVRFYGRESGKPVSLSFCFLFLEVFSFQLEVKRRFTAYFYFLFQRLMVWLA
ncbi:hypothetical protein HMPREF9441_03764 [Paraprevotella clara YIT 11840]|uniref:Uncharacterized protein n=1 Tax=Paraprevotella clara YIT 11840 TaxID=762968 RepID=G5SWJ1_9BACT|nr:hypothetical protein HMPREF9441_03764 [Paraprevotella clara YIT 11840]